MCLRASLSSLCTHLRRDRALVMTRCDPHHRRNLWTGHLDSLWAGEWRGGAQDTEGRRQEKKEEKPKDRNKERPTGRETPGIDRNLTAEAMSLQLNCCCPDADGQVTRQRGGMSQSLDIGTNASKSSHCVESERCVVCSLCGDVFVQDYIACGSCSQAFRPS